MSQYINFYLKPYAGAEKKDFIAIGDFSRNSKHFIVSDEHCLFPWEKGVPISEEKFEHIFHLYDDEIERMEGVITQRTEMIATVSTFNNSAEEKMDIIDGCYETIEWAKEEIEELRAARAWYISLSIIANTRLYSDSGRYTDAIWAGIEWDAHYEEKE